MDEELLGHVLALAVTIASVALILAFLNLLYLHGEIDQQVQSNEQRIDEPNASYRIPAGGQVSISVAEAAGDGPALIERDCLAAALPDRVFVFRVVDQAFEGSRDRFVKEIVLKNRYAVPVEIPRYRIEDCSAGRGEIGVPEQYEPFENQQEKEDQGVRKYMVHRLDLNGTEYVLEEPLTVRYSGSGPVDAAVMEVHGWPGTDITICLAEECRNATSEGGGGG